MTQVKNFTWWARDPRMWIDNSVENVPREAEEAALEHLTARATYSHRLEPSLLYRRVLYYDIQYMATTRNGPNIVNRDSWVGVKCRIDAELVAEILGDIDRMMLAGDVCEVEIDWSYSPFVYETRSA